MAMACQCMVSKSSSSGPQESLPDQLSRSTKPENANEHSVVCIVGQREECYLKQFKAKVHDFQPVLQTSDRVSA